MRKLCLGFAVILICIGYLNVAEAGRRCPQNRMSDTEERRYHLEGGITNGKPWGEGALSNKMYGRHWHGYECQQQNVIRGRFFTTLPGIQAN